MNRCRSLIPVALAAVCMSGCAMCCGPDMYTYPTHGGRIQRSDLEYGRVGSIYSDPVLDSGVISAVPTQAVPAVPGQPNQPTPVEQLEQSTTQSSQGVPAQPVDSRRQEGWR
jgi:hypothetical protein